MVANLTITGFLQRKHNVEAVCISLLSRTLESCIDYYKGKQEPEDMHNFLIYCFLDFVSSIKFGKMYLVGNCHNQKSITRILERRLHSKIL